MILPRPVASLGLHHWPGTGHRHLSPGHRPQPPHGLPIPGTRDGTSSGQSGPLQHKSDHAVALLDPPPVPGLYPTPTHPCTVCASPFQPHLPAAFLASGSILNPPLCPSTPLQVLCAPRNNRLHPARSSRLSPAAPQGSAPTSPPPGSLPLCSQGSQAALSSRKAGTGLS